MILAPKFGYIRVKCIRSCKLIDEVWGDCSIYIDEWYDSIEQGNIFLVKFNIGLCPYPKSYFLTESEVRDKKIDDII